jgi:hypothetical protein
MFELQQVNGDINLKLCLEKDKYSEISLKELNPKENNIPNISLYFGACLDFLSDLCNSNKPIRNSLIENK